MKLNNIKDKLNINHKNKHRIIAVGYAVAVAFAFILSLTNNNDVNASISPNERFDYLMLENAISTGMVDTSSVYPQSSVENIKSLFEMVNYKEKERTVENEIVVSKGDTFMSILTKLGLEYAAANDIYLELKKVYDPRNLRIGQKLQITTIMDTQEDKLLSLENIVISGKAGERFILSKKENNRYFAKAEKDELLEEINSASGRIEGTLSKSMNKQGVPNKIVANFINIFAYSIDFRRDVRKGDTFEIIYENQLTPDGQLVKTGNILYASLTLRKDKISLYRFKDKNGNVDYFNEKGLAMKKTLHRKPLAFQNARISSPFGRRRHPIFKDLRVHWGVDYAAPQGTAVYAGGDGVVQVAKYNGGYGNYIKIRHNSEYSTAYGHMKSFAKGIHPGVRVKQGQIIGYVGSTGRSTGPHLHYEVVKNGTRVNPLTIKASAGENLQGTNLANFKKQVASIKESHKNMFAESKNEKLASK